MAAAGVPRAQVEALARAYLDFAAAERGLFELMFSHDLLHGNRVGLRALSLSQFRVLEFVAEAGGIGAEKRVLLHLLYRPRIDGLQLAFGAAAQSGRARRA